MLFYVTNVTLNYTIELYFKLFNREIMGYKSLFLKTLGVYLVSSFTINAQVIQFERFYDETLAQASYIIANEDKEAIVRS